MHTHVDEAIYGNILIALSAGVCVAIIAGALGCFVVWRRMAYFGDSLAHSSLLGVALGILYGFDINIGVVAVCSAFAMILLWLQQKKILANDTLLGILAHGALSIGMVAISFLDDADFDLHDYLFGDIMTIGIADLYWIYGAGIVVIMLLILNWASLTLMTINEDLAKAEGVNTFLMQLLFMFLITVVVASSIKIIGILLVTSLLIIPAATARQLVRSPESMAVVASLLGIIAVVIGILASVEYGTPSGPTIVTTATIIFAVLFPVSLLKKR